MKSRLRDDTLRRKLRAAELFADRVVERIRERIYAIYLFGSVAKGATDIDSKVDILIVADRKDDALYGILSDVAFEVFLSTGESIEFLVLTWRKP